MDEKIDQEIKNILYDLQKAHEKSEKFYGKQLNQNEPIIPVNIMEMALAFDSEERLIIELDLAYIKKYPNLYSQEQKDFLIKEHKRLKDRVRAWQNKQFPSQREE